MPALVYALTALLGAAAAATGVAGMLGAPWTLRVDWLVPLGGLALEMDPLAGLFVALVGAAAVPVSVYAIGYAGRERQGCLAYAVFVAAMLVVPLAANVMTFALAWELMSLASYVLVLDGARAGRQPAASAHAGWVYAVMTHAGLACLLAGMLLLTAWTGSARFADWAAAAPTLSAESRSLVWALLALGFATKAGGVPLHVWLPLAHPAAPSHVSALMSGVMIKLGIYGLLRASFVWLAPALPWWGATLLLVGAVSAVTGVLYAIVDRDLKRLLAFSSIENVGIVLVGTGAALAFAAAALPMLALLALAAALYHVVNHAAFKSLLFMAAGSVLHGTGTRDMEALGGLIKRQPWTAACFLVGAVAIAGLPPLNGFVSEWLTFQALLQNIQLPNPTMNLVFALAIAGLALAAGLAVAAFVKAFGITFLALPRSDAAAGAHEAPVLMRVAMVATAAACAALALGASAVVPALAAVAATLVPAPTPITVGAWLTLDISGDFASLSVPAVAVALAGGVLLPVLLLVVARARPRVRRYETWGCGRLLQTARMEYTATAFADPFTRVFDFFYRPATRLDVDVHPESRFFVRRIRYENPTRFIVDEWLYRPVVRVLRAAARRAAVVQSGSPNLYLAYVLVALLLLLLVA
ncbi:MAG TPA: proton-conducting transporter membrane subunit [Patescibacteria group bacterium]|nr:proton-conducting transporter membrane subunit [Patescibacteria group bacterium]